MGPLRPPAAPAAAGSTVPGRQAPPASSEAARLRKSATDFEALIIGHMLKAMHQTVPEGRGVFSGSAGRMYRDLMDEEMAKVIARGGGLGLGEILHRDLQRHLVAPRNSSSSDPARPIQERTTPGTTRGREGDRHEDPR